MKYFSRTLEDRLGRYFAANGGAKRWTNALQSINTAINNTVHSSINMRPCDVDKGNARELFDYLSQLRKRKRRKTTTKFNLGDFVRIPLNPLKNLKILERVTLLNGHMRFFRSMRYTWAREFQCIISEAHKESACPGAFMKMK